MSTERKPFAEEASYVCPQCGPDPAGAWQHTQTHHVWHGGEEDAAVLASDVTTCQQCWAMIPKQYVEAHAYWHEKLDEQIGGDPDA